MYSTSSKDVCEAHRRPLAIIHDRSTDTAAIACNIWNCMRVSFRKHDSEGFGLVRMPRSLSVASSIDLDTPFRNQSVPVVMSGSSQTGVSQRY
jgi:hypothetical protein